MRSVVQLEPRFSSARDLTVNVSPPKDPMRRVVTEHALIEPHRVQSQSLVTNSWYNLAGELRDNPELSRRASSLASKIGREIELAVLRAARPPSLKKMSAPLRSTWSSSSGRPLAPSTRMLQMRAPKQELRDYFLAADDCFLQLLLFTIHPFSSSALQLGPRNPQFHPPRRGHSPGSNL